jgi:hypothetical protein
MPRIVIEGFALRVYTDDHHPAHVHVFRAGAEIRVYLRGRRPYEKVAGRMSASDIRRALRIVGEHHEERLRLWRKYHQ